MSVSPRRPPRRLEAWPAIKAGQRRADRRAHRLRQDAGGFSGGDRRSRAPGRRGPADRCDAGRLCLAAQGAVQRHPSQSRSAARGHSRRTRRGSACPTSKSAPGCAPATRPSSERERMRRRPPHIVVTTPESLYVLLGSESGRKMLATTRSVIVDEIHALAPNKRGAHLALSLERLAALVRRPDCCASACPPRRSRSSTVAHFLVGAASDGAPAQQRSSTPATSARATSTSRSRTRRWRR